MFYPFKLKLQNYLGRCGIGDRKGQDRMKQKEQNRKGPNRRQTKKEADEY
jgi:hypothetical protein